MEAITGPLIPITFLAMVVLERLFPGRPLPKVRFWALKGAAFFIMCAALAAGIPAALTSVLGAHAPVHVRSSLPLVLAALVAFLAGDFVFYFLHRLMHNVPFIWR
jgi:sterol desaturase/sphingolipid hydroxylase (fatty acid hydroxylase superfamily)